MRHIKATNFIRPRRISNDDTIRAIARQWRGFAPDFGGLDCNLDALIRPTNPAGPIHIGQRLAAGNYDLLRAFITIMTAKPGFSSRNLRCTAFFK